MSVFTREAVAGFLLVFSAFCLTVGVLGPVATVVFSVSDALDPYLFMYFPEPMAPRSKSIVETVATLFEHKNFLLGSAVLAFSVLFPAGKLGVLMLFFFAEERLPRRAHVWLHGATEWLGRFSMADVFVVTLMIVSAKELPGGLSIVKGWAIWFYLAGVLSTMLAFAVLKPRALPGAPPAPPTSSSSSLPLASVPFIPGDEP